ncbi:vitamin K epoxide reductase family protein [Kineosporia babensis]|uniref:Vitamin K epoxide reductase family protein n=1 Tax=Kineosporia babensis TaxID=499548 RepID=A0A9X1SWV8_9ACTN|nr:vitamin K epoxide reductase family protein [Kineosporia babensis]MCD5315191.1 vitamin K epoxide reductase family protein [Kineosporia babensis]
MSLDTRSEPTAPPRADVRHLALLLIIGASIGLAASFTLMVEKIHLLSDPTYVPSCTVNAVLSCGPVMSSDQAGVFGFPNPLLGIAGFPLVIATGAVLLAGARLRSWYWVGLQIGVTAGFGFVHWLIFQTLFRIGALCPYCMVVWAVTAPIFWFVTLYNLRTLAARRPGSRPATISSALATIPAVPLVIWYLAVFCLVMFRFWDEFVGLSS